MELSSLESFHFLFRSVWNQNTDESVVRHKVNIMDTIIFLQGFPVRWIFTSEKTGEVLRKKDMAVEEIVKSLKKRTAVLKAANKRSSNLTSKKHCFAVVWYKDENGKMASYRINEYQMQHMLKERIFTQALVAIQIYFEPIPFKGSGIFEHHYDSQKNLNVGAHKTYELVETPPSPNYFDLHERIIEQGTYEEFTQTQSQANMAMNSESNTKHITRELITVTETQHSLIKVSVGKLIKLMEKLIGSEVYKATFTFYFNENWSPIVVSSSDVVIRATASRARIMMYSGNDHAEIPIAPPPATPYVNKKSGSDRKIVKNFRSLKHLSKGSGADIHAHSDSDSDHSSDYFSDDDVRNSAFRSPPPSGVKTKLGSAGRRGTSHNVYAMVKPDNPKFIPPPQPGLPASTTMYSKGECTPENKQRRRVGIGVRSTALLKILLDASKNETKVQFADTSEPARSNNHTRGLSHTNSLKSYMMNTEQSNMKVKAYKEDVCGKDPSDLTNRRPISAPHGVRRSSALLDHDPFTTADLTSGQDSEETAERKPQLRRQISFRKKLPLQKDTCFGDYCGLLSRYLEEWEIDKSLIKIKDAEGNEKYKNVNIPHQIPTKSIFLCRSEVSYAGYDIALQENLECLGHDKTDILTACATNHIQNVSDKCRREALMPMLSMAQLKTSKSFPTMKEILVTSFVYRNMVYNDALSKVHPARFYYTAPVCEVCNNLYTALDEARANIIYRKLPQSSEKKIKLEDTHSLTLGETDSSGSFDDRINRARENLRMQAERKRLERSKSIPEEDEEEDGNNFKKSGDSSKIPWESNFMFEMNALQEGSIVMAPVSLEESVFLEETDAVAQKAQLKHNDKNDRKSHGTECKGNKNEVILNKVLSSTTGLTHHNLPLRDYQKSMTSLLNPSLGKTEEVKPDDVQHGILKTKSRNSLKPSSSSYATNNFSSWANLLNAANHKGKRRRPHKGFQLRTTYKNNPAVERKRKEILDSRRLDRQHDIWTNGLHKSTELGVYTQSTGKRKGKSDRRPHSAGSVNAQRRQHQNVSPVPQRISNQEFYNNDPRSHYFESSPKGKRFELETEEDIKEFNDIKVDILKNRGLHSVQVKKSTKVLCGGEFTHVLMHPVEDDEAHNNPHISPQPLPIDKKLSASDMSNSQIANDNTTSLSSLHLLESSSSAPFAPLSYSQFEDAARSIHHRNDESDQATDHDVKEFISELLKNSPMSPQNMDFSSMKNTHISNDVEKMIDELQ